MKYVRAGLRRFRDLFRTDRLERDLADELEAHLQLHTQASTTSGACVPTNAAGAIPTTVNGQPLTTTDCPTIPESALNRRCQ
jgi:hypothetical protein